MSSSVNKSYKTSKQVKSIIIYILMVIFALIAIVPVWLSLVNATRTNAQINEGLAILPSTHALDNWHILTSRSFKI